MSDKYVKKRAVREIDISELKDLHTGTLLARMKRLRACMDDISQDEYFDISNVSIVSNPDLIFFKSDPRWKVAHSDLKDILAKRPHLEKSLKPAPT